MAPTIGSPCQPSALEKHLTCSICMKAFRDPVTTACGHSFCKNCLRCSFQYHDRACPLCKTHLSKAPCVNIVLRDLVKMMKKENGEVATADEVACDVCIEKKRRAKKSCLVCLASYCAIHVKSHYSTKRLRGHKLVEPVEDLDERACLKHGRPLELFSRRQQTCICVRCMEANQPEVVSTEDEWDNKMTEVDSNKAELKEKIKQRKTKLDEITLALENCKDQLQREWCDIEAVFTAVLAIVEEAQATVLQPLKDRRQVLEKEAKFLKDELEAEINKLQMTILELDDISALEDHILFLQSYPSMQDLNNITDCSHVELDTSLSFGNMRKTTTVMMQQIQQELEKLSSVELKRIPKFAVDVKLDPATAHRRLVVSEDGKQVKDGGKDQKVANAPERFDLFGGILGVDSFSSGRSYWEVEVTNKTGWDLGVARGDANRKGRLRLNPDDGYWVTALYDDEKFAALTAPPRRLSLEEKPEKVGVFVDYDEGLVSFYDVNAQSHIYSFTECSFKDELYPYFSPHAKLDEKNAEPLVISAGSLCEQDEAQP
ncbi:E3 ubiquitin-protein ligase TRIM39-like [Stegastes partitus]|uniref:E3 ubiquitin-protein ligase TRIM39-like n=1 Tax=Stegastes partitus TaxID=144197 RepID=A0A3B5A742_9TELE|nr:PREDICTED: E3 ubiquitin-protein ligase TRIM39-like [Stegastes partitus]